MASQHERDTGVLGGVDDPRLVEALEANTAAAYADMARNLGGDVYSGPDMTRYISGVRVHILNGVSGAILPEERLDTLLDAILGRFKAQAAPMIWWIGPSTRPDDLGARLEAHGLTYSGETPGMAAEIGALSPAEAAIPALSVAPATSEGDLAEWARITTRGFGFPEDVTPALAEMAMRHCIRDNPQWAYCLARLSGQPVATASVFLYAGVAGVYCVATLPEARRRGIGAEITRLALQRAGEQGYRVGILQSSDMGFPVYCRLGFQTRLMFRLYAWTPQG